MNVVIISTSHAVCARPRELRTGQVRYDFLILVELASCATNTSISNTEMIILWIILLMLLEYVF